MKLIRAILKEIRFIRRDIRLGRKRRSRDRKLLRGFDKVCKKYGV